MGISSIHTENKHERRNTASAIELGVVSLLLAFLLFAPLIKGGNRPIPLLVLELASLPLLSYLAWRVDVLRQIPRIFLFALGLFVLYPLLQWLPLPGILQQWLPGQDIYHQARSQFADLTKLALLPLSVVPQATAAAWLSLLPPVAILLVTMSLREDALKRAVYVFLAIAVAQAILALLQFGGGSQTAFRLSPTDFGEGVGTYVNRNHLAGLLEMALPIALGLLAASVGRKQQATRYIRGGFIGKLGHALSHPPQINTTMIFSAISIAILLGLIFSRSRTGVGLVMVGVFLSALLYGRYIGGNRSKSLVTLFTVVGVALAIEIGLAPVLDRFSVSNTLEDARWEIFATSFQGVLAFFPFGSGLGTFPDVYWRFQPDSIGLFVNHAHNDYIEYVFETGVVGVLVITLLLASYVLRWSGLLRHEHWGRQTFMQVGAGIALLVMGLHGLTDYNLHIPANAVYFAFLAGVFFHRSVSKQQVERDAAQAEVSQAPVSTPVSPPVPRVAVPNPFSE